MKKSIVKILFIILLLGGFLFISNYIFAAPIRGLSGDLWADKIIGKPDFSEITGNSMVANKVYLIHGTIVDRNIEGDEKLYAYDSMDNRIMGINLNSCLDNGTNPLNCSASIVIGQPNMNTSACNGDSAFQNYPNRAPASASSLCTEQESQLSIAEGGSGSSMAVDSAGSLYVTDFWNNRVLKYISPFTTDQVADEVWGQTDFINNSCNKGNSDNPTADSLCFDWGHSNNWTAGVDVDTFGNVWVVDSGNNRVLRFPPGSKTADLVLGQTNFTSKGSGSGLNEFFDPAAVRVNASGRVYVADQGNNRVLIFDTPATGATGEVFGSDFGHPAGLDFDPTQAGIWIANTDNVTIELWSETLPTTKIKEIGKALDGNVLNGSTGSIGINRAGDLFPGVSGGNYGRNIFVYLKNADPVQLYPDNTFFNQDNNPNNIDLYGLSSGIGVSVSDNQLQVLDDNGRLLFWNDPISLTNGQIVDGSIQIGIDTVGSFAIDANHHLYLTAVKNPDYLIEIQVYDLPLTAGAVPSHTIGTFVDAFNLSLPLLGGGNILLSLSLTGLASSPTGDFLWVADQLNNRVLRIRNPLSSPVVDVILGQTNAIGTLCNQNGSADPNPADATDSTLCRPGSLALDRFGNLFVSDHSLEITGNFRLLRFDNSLFPIDNTEVIYGVPASKIFPDIATWQPSFDSQNRMVVGYNPYLNYNLGANPDGGWFPGIYNDPLSEVSFLPDSHIKDFYSTAYATAFDSNDNLYITDMNRSRLLIYKSPFNVTPTVDAGIDQIITLPNTATLTGTASDDGIPASPGLTVSWTKISGSGTVTFSDSSNVNSTATFSEEGNYVLRLTATDGEFSVSDDISILINERPNSGGGGGGGGGGNKKPKILVNNMVSCIMGQIFNPITGQKCTTFSTPNYQFGTLLIKQGSRGTECKAWQMYFNNHLNSQLNLDGVCGPKTITVARLWQSSVGLKADGILGVLSRNKANNTQ